MSCAFFFFTSFEDKWNIRKLSIFQIHIEQLWHKYWKLGSKRHGLRKFHPRKDKGVGFWGACLPAQWRHLIAAGFLRRVTICDEASWLACPRRVTPTSRHVYQMDSFLLVPTTIPTTITYEIILKAELEGSLCKKKHNFQSTGWL